MRALLQAEARSRRSELELERLLKGHRDAAAEILQDLGRRLKSTPGPNAEDLVHLARALSEVAGVQRIAGEWLRAMYGFRLARELELDEEELDTGTVH